jgi:hypothetical protein
MREYRRTPQFRVAMHCIDAKQDRDGRMVFRRIGQCRLLIRGNHAAPGRRSRLQIAAWGAEAAGQNGAEFVLPQIVRRDRRNIGLHHLADLLLQAHMGEQAIDNAVSGRCYQGAGRHAAPLRRMGDGGLIRGLRVARCPGEKRQNRHGASGTRDAVERHMSATKWQLWKTPWRKPAAAWDVPRCCTKRSLICSGAMGRVQSAAPSGVLKQSSCRGDTRTICATPWRIWSITAERSRAAGRVVIGSIPTGVTPRPSKI